MRSAPSRRASTVNGAGPSALSKSFYNDGRDQHSAFDPDFEPANQDFDYEPPVNDTPSRTRLSFNHEENEVEEEEEEEEEVTPRAKKVDKGKKRAVVEEEEQEEENAVEDEIARGLEEVENAPDEEEEDGDPPPKKLRKDDQKEQKPKKPRARAPKRAIISTEESAFFPPSKHHMLEIHPTFRFTSARWRPPQSTAQVQTTRVLAPRKSCLWATQFWPHPGPSDQGNHPNSTRAY